MRPQPGGPPALADFLSEPLSLSLQLQVRN